MSDELIGQLISAGSGVIFALAFMGAVWKLPNALREVKDILKQIFDAAEGGADRLVAANESLTEASKVMRDAMREALNAKNQADSKAAEVVVRLSQVERELQAEREQRSAQDRVLAALRHELDTERQSRQEDRKLSQDQLQAQAAKIRTLENSLQEKDKTIKELSTEREKLLQRVEALEQAQQTPILPMAGAQESKPDEPTAKAAA